MRKNLISAEAGLAMVTGLFAATPDSGSQQVSDTTRKLSGTDSSVRGRAVDAVIDERKALVASLI